MSASGGHCAKSSREEVESSRVRAPRLSLSSAIFPPRWCCQMGIIFRSQLPLSLAAFSSFLRHPVCRLFPARLLVIRSHAAPLIPTCSIHFFSAAPSSNPSDFFEGEKQKESGTREREREKWRRGDAGRGGGGEEAPPISGGRRREPWTTWL